MITTTKRQLWLDYAPQFNFELDEDELLQTALERGFVTESDESDVYIINEDY